VSRHARATPLLRASDLSERVGREVWVKAECLQCTGSFKVRGAAARLEALEGGARDRGVVACSSGNHGRAVAFVAERMGISATVFVPEWVDPVKLEGVRACGADARLIGTTFDESESLAIAYASDTGRIYVSAYDDPWVIAGQGTIGLEILDQLNEQPTAIIAPLSGGGLIGGIAAAVRDRCGADRPRCVAVSATNASVMFESIRVGHPVDLPEVETLANALAGGIGLDNRHSFALIRDLIDEHVLVDERQIASAMAHAVRHLHLVAEGGGAVGIAALLSDVPMQIAREEGPMVVVLSGGNVSTDTLVRILGE
jgi:threonine dehydratase